MVATFRDFASAFRRYETSRYLRTARVQFESRYHWDNFYHAGGLEREVAREIWFGRSEDEMFNGFLDVVDAQEDLLTETAAGRHRWAFPVGFAAVALIGLLASRMLVRRAA